jgi:hypothetical protein
MLGLLLHVNMSLAERRWVGVCEMMTLRGQPETVLFSIVKTTMSSNEK